MEATHDEKHDGTSEQALLSPVIPMPPLYSDDNDDMLMNTNMLLFKKYQREKHQKKHHLRSLVVRFAM